MWLSVAAGVCLTLYLFKRFYKWYTDPLRRIPGPPSLPVFGSALAMDTSKPHISMTKWAERYGSILNAKLLGQTWIIVSSYELVYDMLVKRSKEFAGRPHTTRSSLIFVNDIVFAEGEAFTKRKKLFLRALRNFETEGIGVEQLLIKTTEKFVTHLKSKIGEQVNIAEEFFLFICQIIAQMLYGGEFGLRDPAVVGIQRLLMKFCDFISLEYGPNELDIFPWLMDIPILGRYYRRSLQEVEDLKELVIKAPIRKAIAECEIGGEYDAGGDKSAGVIKYLVGALKTEHYNDGTPKFAPADLEGICMNIIGGGIETARRTITQLVLELCSNSVLVDRLRSELDQTIGRSRQSQLSDRCDMPYVESLIDETNRLLAFFPSLMHKTTEDTSLSGYSIPKHTWVVANIWGIQHDEDIYPDPYRFNPDRFLDINRNRIRGDDPRRKRILVFGGGQRACPGEGLEKTVLFLLVSTLYQNLDFKLMEEINCDVRSYDNENLLKVPDRVMVKINCRSD